MQGEIAEDDSSLFHHTPPINIEDIQRFYDGSEL